MSGSVDVGSLVGFVFTPSNAGQSFPNAAGGTDVSISSQAGITTYSISGTTIYTPNETTSNGVGTGADAAGATSYDISTIFTGATIYDDEFFTNVVETNATVLEIDGFDANGSPAGPVIYGQLVGWSSDGYIIEEDDYFSSQSLVGNLWAPGTMSPTYLLINFNADLNYNDTSNTNLPSFPLNFTNDPSQFVAQCFAAGTRILTPLGEVAVEALRVGDLVTTLSGARHPIRWIGRRRIDLSRHNEPDSVMPIRIMPGAFGPGAPHRALFLSPDHAVFAEGVLIPVKYLANGTTIAQVHVPEVEYFHFELDSHDVILAEGLAAETFLDTGWRGAFVNGGDTVQAHPRFNLSPEFNSLAWEAAGYASLMVCGPEVERVRARVERRKAALIAPRARKAAKTAA